MNQDDYAREDAARRADEARSDAEYDAALMAHHPLTPEEEYEEMVAWLRQDAEDVLAERDAFLDATERLDTQEGL